MRALTPTRGPGGRDALEGNGPQRRFQKRLYRRRRLPKRLRAVTVGYKCHLGWHSASGGQWLGIGWAPWRGGGGTSPPSPLPVRPSPGAKQSHVGAKHVGSIQGL